MRFFSQPIAVILASFLCLVLASGCGRHVNTPLSRQWEGFNTRFNVYYNGKVHFDEEREKMISEYSDDYSRLLPVFPASARGDDGLPQPQGDFTRTIEKMQKAIELHSISRRPSRGDGSRQDREYRSRGEYNPFIHNAWMLLGEALFQNGDFSEAAATFRYISRHFKWLPHTVTEARLREALALSAMGLIYEAQDALRPVKADDIDDRRLRLLNAEVRADVAIRSENLSEAVFRLGQAVRLSSGFQRNRLQYLRGQIFTLLDSLPQAGEAFREAGKGATVPRSMKINSRIRRSESAPSASLNDEIRTLRKMIDFEANKNYRGQLAYAIANLELGRGDTVGAIRNYGKAMDYGFSTRRDEAVAQLALGRLYYARADYLKAQPLFSEALTVLSETGTYRKEMAISEVLDEYATYAGSYILQDSLLHLASLTPGEQEKIAKRLASQERRRMEQSQTEDEGGEMIQGFVNQQPPGLRTPPAIVTPTDRSWYFYNPRLREMGKTEFQRVWGLRKLEDNWRWSNPYAPGVTDEETPTEMEGNRRDLNAGEHGNEFTQVDAEWYLATIPHGDEEIRNAENIIMESLFNMGLILQDDLDNREQARQKYDELEHRFPDNPFMADIERNRKMLALRENPLERERLISFAGRQDSLYEVAYESYLRRDYAEVDSICELTEREWDDSPILPRLLFLKALGALAQSDKKTFTSLMHLLVERWHDTEPAIFAAGVVRSASKGGELVQQQVRPLRRVFTGVNVSADDSDSISLLPFTADSSEPHVAVLAFSPDSVNPNLVLFETARFNFSTFTVRDHEISLQIYPTVAMVIVRGFDKRASAERYVARLDAMHPPLPDGVTPVVMSLHDWNLLIGSGGRLDEYIRFIQSEIPDNPESKNK